VQVLVGGHALEHAVGDRVAAGLAGVAVADPGGQLLEGHVGDRVEHVLVGDRVVTGDHVLHAGPLECHRVHTAGDHQVVAHDDRVAILLRGPGVDPGAPRAVQGEVGGDLPVVRGQVVLGQQVGDHRGR